MSELHYCQYAFARPDCRVQGIGAGVDPRFEVESIGDGPIAAVVSRIGLDQFDPARLQGATAEDVRWLGQVAARHNEIICRAAETSAVLPLRLGTIFRSRDSLLSALARCRAPVAEFLQRLGDRREWGVKLYAAQLRIDEIVGQAGPPSPHFPSPARTGTDYLTRKKAQIEAKREVRAAMHRTVQAVERCLTSKAEQYCRIRNLPSDLTGRTEEMVFNAAFLLPAAAQEGWLETLHAMRQEVHGKGLLLELSGPWPPYHFCPNLEL